MDLDKEVEKMYCDWSREKQALNMTSIFAELVLVGWKTNHIDLCKDAHNKLIQYSKEEWGKDTRVKYVENSIIIENPDRELKARFTLNSDNVIQCATT